MLTLSLLAYLFRYFCFTRLFVPCTVVYVVLDHSLYLYFFELFYLNYTLWSKAYPCQEKESIWVGSGKGLQDNNSYFIIKNYNDKQISILNSICPFKCLFQLLLTKFSITVLIHRIYKLNNLKLTGFVLISHMEQRAFN